MKPKDTWQFSAPISEVDVSRILVEAGGRVVRVIIGGKVYTIWNTACTDYDPPQGAHSMFGGKTHIVPQSFVFRRSDGAVMVSGVGSGTYRIESGDHVAAIVDRVKVTVEVFELPLSKVFNQTVLGDTGKGKDV